MKIFLSGSKTVRELPQALTDLLDVCCETGCAFLVGDCAGADILMQEYLAAKGCKNVTVYVSGDTVRHRKPCFPVKQTPVAESITGFAFYRQKDIAIKCGYPQIFLMNLWTSWNNCQRSYRSLV